MFVFAWVFATLVFFKNSVTKWFFVYFDVPNLPRGVIPVPVHNISDEAYLATCSTYHGALTQKFKNKEHKPSNKMSVTTALPSWKNTPAAAGRIAKASGAECQTVGSLDVASVSIFFL
jgi:hypothetical protein